MPNSVRRHSRHCPEGRKAAPVQLVKVVEPTKHGLLVTYYPMKGERLSIST